VAAAGIPAGKSFWAISQFILLFLHPSNFILEPGVKVYLYSLGNFIPKTVETVLFLSNNGLSPASNPRVSQKA